MTITTDYFKNLDTHDYQLLQKNLEGQFKKHFDLLVEAVPSIQSIEWTSSQEDGDSYQLTKFKLLKNNNYIFDNKFKYFNNDEISSLEFNKEEIALINLFQNYLSNISNLIGTIYNSENFVLHNDNYPKPNSIVTKKYKI